jgi:hypothetical protein
MRAPNGQSCCLPYDKNTSLIYACDILRRCDEQFESASHHKKPLRFEMTIEDVVMLSECYSDRSPNPAGHLQLFLNDALKQLKMPYQIKTVMGELRSLNFYCYIEKIMCRPKGRHKGELS